MMQFVIDGEIYSFEYTMPKMLRLIRDGIPNKIRMAVATQNEEDLAALFGYVILDSYCARTKEEYERFLNSDAFRKIFWILAMNAETSQNFMKGILKDVTPKGGMKHD